MTAVLFIGSIQLLATGVLGLYIHSIYQEVKERPNYIIESLYGFENNFPVEDEMNLRDILQKLQKIKLPWKRNRYQQNFLPFFPENSKKKSFNFGDLSQIPVPG